MTNRPQYRTVDGVALKQCKACLEWKPLGEEKFARHKEGHLGFRAICRSCMREYNRQYYPQKPKIRKPIKRLARDDPMRVQRALPKEAAEFLRAACVGLGSEPVHKAYLIRNIETGESYVGITVRQLRERWRQHILTAINKEDGYLVHEAIREYGLPTFEFKFLACARSVDDLYALERILIAQYDSVRSGYNQTTGGGASEAVGKPIEVAGQRFISLNSAARHYGIPEYSVAQRISRYGWSLEQALEIVPRPKRPARRQQLKVGEVEFPNLEEACRAHGQTSSAVRKRLSIGWTLEQALGIAAAPPKHVQEGTKLTVDGVEYPSIAVAARAFKTKPATVRFRLCGGHTVRQALGLDPLDKKPTKGLQVSVSGQAFESMSEAARHYGIDSETVASRIKRGWTIEQAFGVVPPPDRSLPGHSVEIEGIVYKSRAAAARAYGLSPKLVHKRTVELGWTLEQALGIEPKLS